jgi:hypothetical protein
MSKINFGCSKVECVPDSVTRDLEIRACTLLDEIYKDLRESAVAKSTVAVYAYVYGVMKNNMGDYVVSLPDAALKPHLKMMFHILVSSRGRDEDL